MTALSVIRGIVSLTYILVISPYMLGCLLCYKLEGELMDSFVLKYEMGFFSQLGIWGFFALPVKLFTKDWFSFHRLCLIYLGALFVMSLAEVYILLKDRQFLIKPIKNDVEYIKRICNENLLSRVLLSVVACLVILQAFQCVYGIGQAVYNDNIYYTSETLKTIDDDIIYLSGAKAILAPWRSFLPALALLSGQHPLFINETILPVSVLVLFYFALFISARFLFEGNEKLTVYYISAFCVFITIFGNYMFANEIMAIYPLIWGKAILGSTGLPMTLICVVLFYESYRRKKERMAQYIWLLSVFGAGCAWLSMMSMVVIPIGVLSMLGYYAYKKKDVRVVCFAMAELTGVIVQMAIYVFIFHIGVA